MTNEEVPFQQHISEFPDRVLSYIFSKLSVKDLVKTSILSKQWLRRYQGLRADLNFDVQNVFDNTTLELPESLPLFKEVQSQFAKRVDQLMLNYEGSLIRSLRVKFPLGDEQSDFIGKLISQGISKGIEQIELHFSFKTSHFHDMMLEIEPYKFAFTLLLDTNSLKYLHLENCRLSETMQFSGIKNLKTLVLHLVTIERTMLQGILSNCIHLVNLTLDECVFNFVLTIISPTLCHLNILNHYSGAYWRRIDIIAFNLSSFEFSYFNHDKLPHTINIMANKLSKFRYKDTQMSEFVGFYALKYVSTIVLDGLTEPLDEIAPGLFSECLQLEDVTFKNCTVQIEVKIISPMLRHLNMIDCASWRYSKIYIDALNLSSFDYSGMMMISSIKAPKLLKVFWNATKQTRPRPFNLIASLHELESLAMIMSHSQIAKLPKVRGPFQNLGQLKLFLEGAYDSDIDYFWILDIAMVSPRLQKLSLTIRNSHMINSHGTTLQRQRREYVWFFHTELKYVEFHGCVGTINVIELASHLLRNVNSLKQITFSPRDRFYMGDGRWTECSESCGCFERNLIREMLEDEINEECELIIL